MSRKSSPVLTHTEILCFAIRHLEMHLQQQYDYYNGIPECEPMLNSIVTEIKPKLDALYQLYKIETGVSY